MMETAKNMSIKQDDLAEFAGQIIDVFEDFLEDRGINFMTDDKRIAIEEGDMAEDDMCIIYGCDYGELQSSIEYILRRWKLVE